MTVDSHDALTPAQRTAVERLIGEAYGRHRRRCAGLDRVGISEMQSVLAEEIREAYVIGMRAREQAET